MRKTVLNRSLSTALCTVLMVSMGVGLSACSSEKEGSGEVMAIDRVDDAAELARKNGPEAEDMKFPETAPMPAVDAEADATLTTEAGVADADMAESTPTEDTATAVADGAAMPAADASTSAEAEPVSN